MTLSQGHVKEGIQISSSRFVVEYSLGNQQQQQQWKAFERFVVGD